jgi:hypothetical protein
MPAPRATTSAGLTARQFVLCCLIAACVAVSGQAAPALDPCATGLLVETIGGTSPPPTSSDLALVLWTRNAAIPADPIVGEWPYAVVWKTVPIQQGFQMRVDVGVINYFSVMIGVYHSSWSTSEWYATPADSILSVTVDDAGTFPASATITTGCQTAGGPQGCVMVVVVCAAGSTCTKNPYTIQRSDQSGIPMELVPANHGDGKFFLITPNEVVVSLDMIGVQPRSLISSNARRNMLAVQLNEFAKDPTMGECTRQGTFPPPVPVLVNIDVSQNVLSLGPLVSEKGNTCSESLIVQSEPCSTITFNYTTEVAAMENEAIAVWIEPTAWASGGSSPPAGYRPTVWKVFYQSAHMVSFALPVDSWIGVMQASAG